MHATDDDASMVTPRVIIKTIVDEEMEKELTRLRLENEELEKSREAQKTRLGKVEEEKLEAQRLIDDLEREKHRLTMR